MHEILVYIINTLKADSTLTALIPATNIMAGPIDITVEKETELIMPQINLHVVSEAFRSVPSNVRDTMVQLDVWSMQSQLELDSIYEQVLLDMNYVIADQNTAHIFWQRLGSANDQYESDRRIWHRACTFQVWSQKP